jgi:5,10-methylene-tetrahydrofolate dehydrogenase/methenyl tetrahydrofolate cyclohydrolase
MTKRKNLDCVKLKNQIQAELQEEYQGLSESEIMETRLKKILLSDDPIAKKWRNLQTRGKQKSIHHTI